MTLFDKHPVVIDKNVAKVIGLNEAIILQQVHYWIEINKKAKRNFEEGKYWTYNTMEEWNDEFPFWSKDTVKRTFKRLREMGLMVIGNFNSWQVDRTLWYTIDYGNLNELIEEERANSSIGAKCPNGNEQNAPMQKGNFTPTIPENSTEITSEISNQSINPDNARNNSQGTEGNAQFSVHNSQLEDEKINSSSKINTETKTNSKENYKEMDGLIDYEKIIKKCEIEAIDENYRTAVSHAIRLLLIQLSSSTKIKIGDKHLPSSMVRRDMDKLNFFVVDYAVNKFKEASGNYEIRNPISYLKSCIYNAIYAIDIDVDAKLRNAGLI